MNHFTLSSEQKLDLKSLNIENISIKKIIPHIKNIQQLVYPIFIEQKFANGSIKSHYLIPLTFYSNFKPEVETDLVIDEIIHDCNITSLSIIVPKNLDDIVKFDIFYEPVEYIIQKLVIHVVKQMDGFNYSLPPKSLQEIKLHFTDAHPVANVFIAYDVKSTFEYLHGSIENHVLSALTGLNENQLGMIKNIEYIDPRNNFSSIEKA